MGTTYVILLSSCTVTWLFGLLFEDKLFFIWHFMVFYIWLVAGDEGHFGQKDWESGCLQLPRLLHVLYCHLPGNWESWLLLELKFAAW